MTGWGMRRAPLDQLVVPPFSQSSGLSQGEVLLGFRADKDGRSEMVGVWVTYQTDRKTYRQWIPSAMTVGVPHLRHQTCEPGSGLGVRPT